MINQDYSIIQNSILYYENNHQIPSSVAESNKIKSLIKNYIKDLNQVDEIKITCKSIQYYKHENEKWHTINLNGSNQKTIQLILRNSSCLVLKHDRLGEKIAETIKQQDIPTLYFYSSGGGGHKSAKDAKVELNLTKVLTSLRSVLNENDPLQQDPRLKSPAELINYCKKVGLIQEVDVLNDYLDEVGKWSSRQWDEAKVAGDVQRQESLASKQRFSDAFFGPVVFIKTLRSLIAHKPTIIVSTQAMATPAILLAIHVYNIFYKPSDVKDVKLHLYMTDMPTEYSSHFFDSLKKLYSISGKDHLVLHTPKPRNEVDWQILCNLPDGQVRELTTNELPVRPAFLQAIENYHASSEPQVQIKVSGPQELDVLRKVLHHQDSAFNPSKLGDSALEGAQSLTYSMKPEDEGYFLMLGSQPTKQAVKDYVDQFCLLAQENPAQNYHLFAYTGKFEADKENFYTELSQAITEIHAWPSNLRVVPLSFQDPIQIVSLELQCDTITYSGGGSVMELLVLEEKRKQLNLPAKRRFIHAQKVEQRTLEDSIPVWEKGNYLFLRDELSKDRVKVINPKSCRAKIKKPKAASVQIIVE